MLNFLKRPWCALFAVVGYAGLAVHYRHDASACVLYGLCGLAALEHVLLAWKRER